VHVWRAFLEIGEPEFHRISPVLSADERSRAERFRFPSDRRAFLVSRAVLRSILARYVGEDAAKLPFRYGEHGKPALHSIDPTTTLPATALAGAEAQWLRFNVSHSHGLALYAMAREREVGVDVERIQPELASWQVASEFFAASEIHALRKEGDDLDVPAFFACWTRKEAYLKARGSGLAAPLNSFAVPVDPALDHPATVTEADCVWSLHSLDVGEGYAAACAAEGEDWSLRLWQWSPDSD
jgi:4'-phosphopantetheinyl transferase